MEKHLAHLVDYQFTAEMEDELDAISRGELEHVEYLRRFYFGDGHPGLKEEIKNKLDEIDARDVSRVPIGKPVGEGQSGEPIYVRVGRYGPFLEQGDRRASLPDKLPPDELTLELALKMLDKAAQSQQPLGICPETHKPVFVKEGRFGPYVQRGTPDNDDQLERASLLKGMRPEDVDLPTALRLLSLPRRLGTDPQSGAEVSVHNGRYGPYVKCGDETRSLSDGVSPLEVTLEQALALLAQPKPRRGAAARKEPIKVFETSPVTGQPVRLMEGRYGPYVADGVTNASLPRGMSPEAVTFVQALELLQARAAKGPAKRPARRPARKTTARKTTAGKTAKKAVKKKTAKKKTAKKRTAKKEAAKQ